MTTHVMFDLETWGLTPGSDIRSIGAVVFDPIAGLLGEGFYINVDNPKVERLGHHKYDPTSEPKWPLTRDPDTEMWWDGQSEEAKGRFRHGVVELDEGLRRFSLWIAEVVPDGGVVPEARNYSELALWCHGPHFDEAILGAVYRAVSQEAPWTHRAPRDCRTIWEAAGWPTIPFEGVPHYALDDAIHQARCVIEAYRRLGLSRQN